MLTLDGNKLLLQAQVKELKQKTKDNDTAIKTKLEEKDDEIRMIKEQMLVMEKQQEDMRKTLTRQFDILIRVANT